MSSLKAFLFAFIEKFVKFRQANPKLALFLVIITFAFIYHRNKKYLKGKKSLKGKNVLITGGVSGIGRKMALIFKQKGANVIVFDINDAGLKEMQQNVNMALKCDITDKSQVTSCAQTVLNEFNVIDILINNAGIVIGKRILDLTESNIRATFNVNVLSHFWMIQAFLPGMMKQNSGHLVTISSSASRTGCSYLSDYCASKYACRGLSESLSQEIYHLGYDGIKTTCVQPYLINTGMFDGAVASQKWWIKIFGCYFLEEDYVANKIVTAIQYNRRNLVMPTELAITMRLEHLLPDGLKDYMLHKGPQMGKIIGRGHGLK